MTEFPVVLVINCGSSSIKFSVLDAASCDCLLNGVAEGINAEPASRTENLIDDEPQLITSTTGNSVMLYSAWPEPD